MIEVAVDLDGPTECDVVGADEVWTPICDEERAFGRPRTHAFDLGQACNCFVIGESTQLVLGETTVSKAFRELTHHSCFLIRPLGSTHSERRPLKNR
jgi:hypothetical protein